MKAVCYLQVEPTFWGWSSEPKLRDISVQRVTQKQPRNPIPGCVVVKVTLDIGDAAFYPLTPEATVVIPVEHTLPVTAESEPLEVP